MCETRYPCLTTQSRYNRRVVADSSFSYLRAKANGRFDVADENGDGFITRKEAEQAMKQKQLEVRKKMKEWNRKQEERMMQRQP